MDFENAARSNRVLTPTVIIGLLISPAFATGGSAVSRSHLRSPGEIQVNRAPMRATADGVRRPHEWSPKNTDHHDATPARHDCPGHEWRPKGPKTHPPWTTPQPDKTKWSKRKKKNKELEWVPKKVPRQRSEHRVSSSSQWSEPDPFEGPGLQTRNGKLGPEKKPAKNSGRPTFKNTRWPETRPRKYYGRKPFKDMRRQPIPRRYSGRRPFKKTRRGT